MDADAPGLAGDRAMFDAVETGAADHLYRCWTINRPIVVLGRHRSIADDVLEDMCQADGIPVVRRDSGGGTVVLGAGCLNYAVALSLVSRPELIDVAASFAGILRTLVAALDLPAVEVRDTDLAWHGRKVSGNAQRRGRRALLHHGTVLFAFDAGLAERYLKEPLRQPAYRGGRSHVDFMTNLPRHEDDLRFRIERALRRLADHAARR